MGWDGTGGTICTGRRRLPLSSLRPWKGRVLSWALDDCTLCVLPDPKVHGQRGGGRDCLAGGGLVARGRERGRSPPVALMRKRSTAIVTSMAAGC